MLFVVYESIHRDIGKYSPFYFTVLSVQTMWCIFPECLCKTGQNSKIKKTKKPAFF